MAANPKRIIRVFYCYAHTDKRHRDTLEVHLFPLIRSGKIMTWYDQEILPGKEWEREIETHLNTADLILLLISPHFIASDYCYSKEMARALERHRAGETCVIPIILRPVDWEETPFSNLQALPKDGKPITTWPNRDRAYLDVEKGIRKIVNHLREYGSWRTQEWPQPYKGAFEYTPQIPTWQRLPKPSVEYPMPSSPLSKQSSPAPLVERRESSSPLAKQTQTPSGIDQPVNITSLFKQTPLIPSSGQDEVLQPISPPAVRFKTDQGITDSHKIIEQMWYVRSSRVYIGSTSIDAGILAASDGLLDLNSEHMKILDRYLRFSLPQGTSPRTISPDKVPVSLTFADTGQERILVHNVFLGQDGLGRSGAFFVHLLVGLPTSFSAKDAILLWKSPLWQSSDNAHPHINSRLPKVSLDELRQMQLKNIDLTEVREYLPFIIQAFLTRKERQRLYVAAPPDKIAALIYGLSLCLPRQLLEHLNFSTYEPDMRNDVEALLVGTSWLPLLNESISAQHDLPAFCYKEGLAINCYTNRRSPLPDIPFAASFAKYATECLVTNSHKGLEFLSELEDIPHMDVGSFLNAYYLKVLWKPTTIEDITFMLKTPHLAATWLQEEQIQDTILDLTQSDQSWWHDVGQPALKFLSSNQRDADTARALTQLAERACDLAIRAAEKKDQTLFMAMLEMISIFVLPSRYPSVWLHLLYNFSVNQRACDFVIENRDIYFGLLEDWASIQALVDNKLIRAVLRVSWSTLEQFLQLPLPNEWKVMALTELFEASASTDALMPASILSRLDQQTVQDVLHKLTQTVQNWDRVIRIFTKLVESRYPGKMSLLFVLLELVESKEFLEKAIEVAQMTDEERAIFLEHFGERYFTLYPMSFIMVSNLIQYVRTFDVHSLNRSSAISLIRFINTLTSLDIDKELQMRVQSWSIIATFIDSPAITKEELNGLASAIHHLPSDLLPELITKLAPSFTTCIENENDLRNVLDEMGRVLAPISLIQLLTRMAETVGREYRWKRSESLLIPYLQVALEPDSFYKASTSEQEELAGNLLNALLYYAAYETYERLNTAAQNWPAHTAARWATYAPKERGSAILNESEISYFPLYAWFKHKIAIWKIRLALRSKRIAKIVRAVAHYAAMPYIYREMTPTEREQTDLACRFYEAYEDDNDIAIITVSNEIQNSPYKASFNFTVEEQERIKFAQQRKH